MSIDFNNAAYISAARAKYSDAENAARHACLGADLVRYGIEAIDAQGIYKNVPEQSYIARVHNFNDVINLRQLARRYEQESVLFTEKSAAALWFTATNAHEILGTIAETPDAAGDRTVLADGRVLSII